MSETLTVEDVLGMLVRRLATVMALPAEEIGGDSRFDEDLHADSLDLVEVIEGIEADLRERGVSITLPEEDLLVLRTVGEAAERIQTEAAGPR